MIMFKRMHADAEGRFVVHVPRKIPTQNSLSANKGGAGAWWGYHAEKKAWMREIPPCTSPADGPRRLAVIRLMGPRERKFDSFNLIGGLKPIVDVLILRGYLKDDCDELMKFVWPPIQRRAKPDEIAPSTVLIVSPA